MKRVVPGIALLTALLAVPIDQVLAQGLEVRGALRARNAAVLSTDLSARVKKVNFLEGQRFKKNAVLVSFDCTKVKAQSAAAWSAYEARRHTYSMNQLLAKRRAIGSNEVAVSKAEMNQAAAQGKAADALGKDCVIRAPYSGIVVEKDIQAHETSVPGQPLMRIVGTGQLDIELIIPSRWMAWIKTGYKFEFAVDETRRVYPAVISRLGGAVDPESQTVKAFGQLVKQNKQLLSGMSGTAKFRPVNE